MKIIMEEEAKKVLFGVLKVIKYKSDLTPNPTSYDLMIQKEAIKRLMQNRKGLVESTQREENSLFPYHIGKRVDLLQSDFAERNKPNLDDIRRILGVLKQKRFLKQFIFRGRGDGTEVYKFELLLPKNFEDKFLNLIGAEEKEIKNLAKAEKTATNKNMKIYSPIYCLPDKASMKDIEIKIIADDKVKISTLSKREEHHYSDLGFTKTKENKLIGKKCWDFLILLSANNGRFKIDSLPRTEKNQIIKRKQELEKIFHDIFGLKGYEFIHYNREKKQYETNFKLEPPRDLNTNTYEDRNIYENNKNPYEDLEDCYKDMTT